MPLNIPIDLPAIELLRKENIFVLNESGAHPCQSRSLKIALLNLMPTKITTETDFIRLLYNYPLQIDLELIKIKSHKSKNTPEEHMNKFYKNFEDICNEYYDGLIITGAPVELMEYEEVTYWKELQEIFDWATQHVTSTLYICWAAQAALYHFFGVPKYELNNKMFGIFRHTLSDNSLPLLNGFDDEFYVPHSRHTEIRKADILKHPELNLISESEEAGVYMLTARNGREIFITGHSEYAPEALNNEYIRDINKGLPIHVPQNYYIDNDPRKPISVKWRAHANLMFKNWLNHYVAPFSPSDSRDIKLLEELHFNR
ncbi:homoserine O-succinyltransferase [Bacteroidales bacterium OttesenSCG-928-M06]|nr:homoserine O-succinyltransferase [Bacteroidales bacterium OttesenSCG-928-M06]